MVSQVVSALVIAVASFLTLGARSFAIDDALALSLPPNGQPIINAIPKAPSALTTYRLTEAQECFKEAPEVCPKVRKALDQTCNIDSECITPAICAYGRCQCPRNFLTKNGHCIIAPIFNQGCPDLQCAEPFVCNTTLKVCECPDFMNKTAYGCRLDCAPDEIAVETECLKKSQLGKPCSSSLQCSVAYSQCISGKCSCVAGTKNAKDSCIPQFRCPDGNDPIELKKHVLKCMITTCTNPSKPISDTCPLGSFCVFPSYQNLEGFCCPEKPWCPAGDPLPSKNCENPSNESERCPPETHHCFTGPRGTSCCPLPCPGILGVPAVVINGICHAKRQLNDPCEFDDQCPLHAICTKDGQKCQCPEGFTVQSTPVGAKCRRICAGNEKLAGGVCLGMAVPLGPCQHTAQCTGGTRCKDGKCQCPCGKTLYNGQCINKPTCPEFGGIAGHKEPLMSSLESYVECSLQDPIRATPCPKKAYCSVSQGHLAGGVCCPFPDPVCEIGTPKQALNGKPQMCPLSNHSSCGADHYCRDYLSVALPAAQISEGVCCPQTNRSPVPGLASAVGGNPCPASHTLARNAAGDIITCSYFQYSGECGHQSACFFVNAGLVGVESGGPMNRPINFLFNNQNTGVCCNWNPPAFMLI